MHDAVVHQATVHEIAAANVWMPPATDAWIGRAIVRDRLAGIAAGWSAGRSDPRALLAVLPVLLLLGLAGAADQPAAALAGAALAAAGALATLATGFLVASARLAPGRRAQVRAAALRHRARHIGVPVLRDPDAAGRPRPRAPSARPSAG